MSLCVSITVWLSHNQRRGLASLPGSDSVSNMYRCCCFLLLSLGAIKTLCLSHLVPLFTIPWAKYQRSLCPGYRQIKADQAKDFDHNVWVKDLRGNATFSVGKKGLTSGDAWGYYMQCQRLNLVYLWTRQDLTPVFSLQPFYCCL